MTTDDFKANAALYRCRAVEVRAMAAPLHDPERAQTMLRLAGEHENRADYLEIAHGSLSGRWDL
jgi:hypothetical protein